MTTPWISITFPTFWSLVLIGIRLRRSDFTRPTKRHHEDGSRGLYLPRKRPFSADGLPLDTNNGTFAASKSSMRVRAILPGDCARACQQLSLRLDSELSEFETVLLEAHLARCADCREFGQTITGFTNALRAVPAETPRVPIQVTRTRRISSYASALRAGTAAAAVAVVALGGLVALQGSRDRVPGVDLNKARLVMDVHESQLQRLDKFGET